MPPTHELTDSKVMTGNIILYSLKQRKYCHDLNCINYSNKSEMIPYISPQRQTMPTKRTHIIHLTKKNHIPADTPSLPSSSITSVPSSAMTQCSNLMGTRRS